MKPARIILLVLALVAGGLAAFLVMRGGDPVSQTEVVTEVVQEAKAQVLVAKTQIGVGERLDPAMLQWLDWPEGAVQPDYVTMAAMPNAPTELTSAIARFEFFPGEPIRDAKLVRSEQGYLSAVLAEGKRGVSVQVAAVSSAGGFIVPNDRVDVVLTSSSPDGERSEVILSNVKVLAIGKRLGEAGVSGGQENAGETSVTPITFDETTIATLELDPGQSETLINATARGTIALTLRSVADFNDNTTGGPGGANQTVRLIRAGKEQSIMAGPVTPSMVVAPVLPNITSQPVTPSSAPAVVGDTGTLQ
jgi:pilus assembly protein CpaB